MMRTAKMQRPTKAMSKVIIDSQVKRDNDVLGIKIDRVEIYI